VSRSSLAPAEARPVTIDHRLSGRSGDRDPVQVENFQNQKEKFAGEPRKCPGPRMGGAAKMPVNDVADSPTAGVTLRVR
jgi:hypothetical protein